jgi:hypothetical protein
MSLKSTLINFTNDQNAQLFVIASVTTQFKAEDEKIVVKDKTNLKKQILLNESKARIQVITAETLIKSSIMYLINDNDDDEDEISSEIKAHRIRFAELLENEIVKIFIDKFKSINIYKLRHMRDLTHDFYYDQNRIEIENDQLKSLKKTIRIYKNFEKFFINYLLIVLILFAKSSSNIEVTLIKFYQKILKLAKLYD